MEIVIAVAYHKKSELIDSECYMPLHVGSSLHPEVDLGIRRDNEGDNISSENYTYCELTATYWLWKNVKADVKGLVHYRRVFGSRFTMKMRLKRFYHKLMGHVSGSVRPCGIEAFRREAELLAAQLPKMFEQKDVFVAKPMLIPMTVERSFLRVGDFYLRLMEESIERHYPDYLPYYHRMMEGKRLYYANMTIMRSGIFDDYCKFLFTVLEDVRERVVSEGYLIDPKRERAFSRTLGYLGELLTHTYIVRNRAEKRFRVGELPVAFLRP